MNGPEVFGTIFTIAPSRKEATVIWTGSDDGLVYVTRDAARTWQNITPPDLPSLVRISLIEASPHNPGRAYVAAQNYQQDDRAPYIYRADDYGKTWKKIVSGIKPGDYVHAVREDTRRPGLLYAGAEHGIYVSWDNGDNWESLSLNLPDTQVSDIEVQDHDLVIATHGRSMYVLDNIATLRQMKPLDSNYVFQPEDGVRRPRPVAIDYFLKSKAEKVTIEILDSNGAVIRSFSSPSQDKNKSAGEEQGEEEDFRPREPKVTTDAGLNRFVWDLRYAGSTTFPGLVMWGARAEQGPLALPGNYRVRINVNGDNTNALTQTFNITLDPRVHATQADLRKQFDLAMRVRDRVSEANRAVIAVRAVRDQVNERLKTVSLSEARSSGSALSIKLTEVEEAIYQVRNRSNQDPLNFPIKLNNKIAHLMGVIEDADAAPTDQTYTAFDELSKELDAQLARLKTTLANDLPAFNRFLASANAQPVTAPATF